MLLHVINTYYFYFSVPSGTFNWVTESTFDTAIADMEYEATHAPTQGPAAGLVFNVGSFGKCQQMEL